MVARPASVVTPRNRAIPCGEPARDALARGLPSPLGMDVRYAPPIALLVAAMFLLSACATPVTRTARFGPLPDGRNLVTLVVSRERAEVERQCGATTATSGCRSFQPVTLQGGVVAQAVRIVRYVDPLPSDLALEIDIHELCHAVAGVQPILDPCHQGNRGVLQSAARSGSQ